LRNFLANIGTPVAQAAAVGLEQNPNRDAFIAGLVSQLNASSVGPLIAEAVNRNSASKGMVSAILGELNSTTAQTLASALNANPDLLKLMLREIDPAVLADVLNQNAVLPPKTSPTAPVNFIANLLANLDGKVIAQAINDEQAQTGSSIIYRIMTSPNSTGANIANTLNFYGYQFMVDLLSNLDGSIMAHAINNAGKRFLSELIAFLNPDLVVNLIRAEPNPVYEPSNDPSQWVRGGVIKELNLNVFNFMTSLGIGFGGQVFKLTDAATYLPPDAPPFE